MKGVGWGRRGSCGWQLECWWRWKALGSLLRVSEGRLARQAGDCRRREKRGSPLTQEKKQNTGGSKRWGLLNSLWNVVLCCNMWSVRVWIQQRAWPWASSDFKLWTCARLDTFYPILSQPSWRHIWTVQELQDYQTWSAIISWKDMGKTGAMGHILQHMFLCSIPHPPYCLKCVQTS